MRLEIGRRFTLLEFLQVLDFFELREDSSDHVLEHVDLEVGEPFETNQSYFLWLEVLHHPLDLDVSFLPQFVYQTLD